MAIPSKTILLRISRMQEVMMRLSEMQDDGPFFDGQYLRILGEEMEFHAKNLVNDYETWLREE